jgi:hypothetical protein
MRATVPTEKSPSVVTLVDVLPLGDDEPRSQVASAA